MAKPCFGMQLIRLLTQQYSDLNSNLFLVFLLFLSNTQAQQCDMCAYKQCDADASCIYGCELDFLTYKDGYCVGNCLHNCALCDHDLCLTCDKGFFGHSCHLVCNNTCPSTGECNRHIGVCMTGSV